MTVSGRLFYSFPENNLPKGEYMSRGVSQKTKKLTASALLAAMGVAILFLGSVVQTLDLTAAALASFFCIFAVIELGGAYSWMIFAVTGFLSVILMPYSMSGWFYLLFFGYYPILKEKFERLKLPISWLVKMILLNVALAISIITASFIFYGGNMFESFITMFGAEDWGLYAAIGIYALVNVTFVIYDLALTRLISLYIFKLRYRFKFFK